MLPFPLAPDPGEAPRPSARSTQRAVEDGAHSPHAASLDALAQAMTDQERAFTAAAYEFEAASARLAEARIAFDRLRIRQAFIARECADIARALRFG